MPKRIQMTRRSPWRADNPAAVMAVEQQLVTPKKPSPVVAGRETTKVIAMSDKPMNNKPATFAWMIPNITAVAKEHGYAITLHGSMARDLDLVAVPWVKHAAPAETLVEAIRDTVGGYIRNDPLTEENQYYHDTRNPEEKPHGRMAWSIRFARQEFYIDLSVMPTINTPN